MANNETLYTKNSDGGWAQNVSLTGSNVTADGSLRITLSTALSSDFDSMNVNKMGKGGTITAHNAIVATTTSDPIDLTYYKHVSIEIAASAFTSGNWVIELLGCNLIGGAFGNIYKAKDDGTFTQLKTPAISANGTYIYEFANIGAKYIQLKSTRTTDGTLTAKVTPYN